LTLLGIDEFSPFIPGTSLEEFLDRWRFEEIRPCMFWPALTSAAARPTRRSQPC
jgi:hypothetical protein